MSRYSAAVITPAAAVSGTFVTLHSVATDSPRIFEIGIFCNAATASSVELCRPSNTPVASTSLLGQVENPPDPAATCMLDTAWSTAPVYGATPMRRIVLPATIGAGCIWLFPLGLLVPASGWIGLRNFGAAAASALSAYFVWEE
jgi:hypothetical protein